MSPKPEAVCSQCGTMHSRVRGKGWVLSVGANPVCSTRCMARAYLGMKGIGE